MALVGEYLTVKQYRQFKKTDLERIREEIQASGTYPSGWQRPRRPR